jgi:hypothetical protein
METMDDPRAKRFVDATELEAEVRKALPPALASLPLKVDVARQDPRPLNPWTEETKKILIYDPATDRASPQPVQDLFRYIPARVAHYRIFALDHTHDDVLARATQAVLGGPGEQAMSTNV